jgi:hypothetical protein
MRDASICGLGQAAPNPVDCVLKYFPDEVAVKLRPRMTAPAMTMNLRPACRPIEFARRPEAAPASRSRGGAARGIEIPHLCYKDGLDRPTATAAPAWSRSTASACWRRRAAAPHARA